MKCIDCKNPAPHHWKRCEECAFHHLRHLMSEGRVPLKIVGEAKKKVFAFGASVLVTPHETPDVTQPGTILRRQIDRYVVETADGSRLYVHVSELKEATTA